MIELKPCPFCGSDNVAMRGSTIFYIICKDCEASTNISYDRQEAADKWNRRHNEQEGQQ